MNKKQLPKTNDAVMMEIRKRAEAMLDIRPSEAAVLWHEFQESEKRRNEAERQVETMNATLHELPKLKTKLEVYRRALKSVYIDGMSFELAELERKILVAEDVTLSAMAGNAIKIKNKAPSAKPSKSEVVAAMRRGVCRVCGEPIAGRPLVTDFGNEYAHASCLEK